MAGWPRVVAHRGASKTTPENTLPAFVKALSLGVAEVEFDLWATADGGVVVCHDRTLDRTTTGKGLIRDATLAALRGLDAGVWRGQEWAGARVPTVEEVFELVAGRAVMNIHVKEPGPGGLILKRVKELAERHKVVEQVYVAGQRDVMECAKGLAPELGRCCLEGAAKGSEQIERALELDCQRIQFSVKCCSDDDIRRARDLGLVVNFFFCDEPVEAARLFDVGVMALLTNCPEVVKPPAVR